MYSEITEQELRTLLQEKVRHTGTEEELYLVYRALLALMDRWMPPQYPSGMNSPTLPNPD